MSVLKNKRRTSKIEYEKNFLGFYEYMMNLIDHIPKRWQKPLGAPMKEALNQMYDDVLLVSEMYIEKEQSKTRYLQCRKVIEELTADDVYASIQSWITHARIASSYHAVKAMLGLYDMMYEGYRLTRRYWKRNEDLHRKRKVVRI